MAKLRHLRQVACGRPVHEAESWAGLPPALVDLSIACNFLWQLWSLVAAAASTDAQPLCGAIFCRVQVGLWRPASAKSSAPTTVKIISGSRTKRFVVACFWRLVAQRFLLDLVGPFVLLARCRSWGGRCRAWGQTWPPWWPMQQMLWHRASGHLRFEDHVWPRLRGCPEAVRSGYCYRAPIGRNAQCDALLENKRALRNYSRLVRGFAGCVP